MVFWHHLKNSWVFIVFYWGNQPKMGYVSARFDCQLVRFIISSRQTETIFYNLPLLLPQFSMSNLENPLDISLGCHLGWPSWFQCQLRRESKLPSNPHVGHLSHNFDRKIKSRFLLGITMWFDDSIWSQPSFCRVCLHLGHGGQWRPGFGQFHHLWALQPTFTGRGSGDNQNQTWFENWDLTNKIGDC